VRLASGQMLWVDASNHEVKALDRVLVNVSEAEVEAEVYVTPEQLIRPIEGLEGSIVRLAALERLRSECRDLPGSDLPPLGSRLSDNRVSGTVTQIDPLKRAVTITTAAGEIVHVSMANHGATEEDRPVR
jgi:hypothetical protein